MRADPIVRLETEIIIAFDEDDPEGTLDVVTLDLDEDE